MSIHETLEIVTRQNIKRLQNLGKDPLSLYLLLSEVTIKANVLIMKLHDEWPASRPL